jgi:predicted transcriptional regulator
MNYTQIPDDILPKVRTWSAMQLAIWADVHTMGKAGLDYYRTNEQLAERFATDDRTVRRVISQLIACGAITAEQDGKRRILTSVQNFAERKRTKRSPDQLVPGQVSPRTNQSAKEDKLVRDGGPTGPEKEDQLVPQVEHRVEHRIEQQVEQETELERIKRLIEEKEARERGEQPQVQKAVVTIPARGAARPAVVSNKAKPFDAEEVRNYFVQLGDPDPDEAYNFWDHFESNGWLVSGKTPMRDWKASVRRWMRSDFRKPRKKSVGERVREMMERETK